MSVDRAPVLDHESMCRSPIWNDTRWTVRPEFYRKGNSGDMGWVQHPLQPPYRETDLQKMSYDLTMWQDKKGNFKPEVTPDPCYPTPTKYCSFGKSVYMYDRSYPSLTLPPDPSTTCDALRATTTVPDVACFDQQQFMSRDRLGKALQNIDSRRC